MSKALTYNKKQGFSVAEILALQGLTGSDLYGALREEDVSHFQLFQSNAGLAADGMMGPKSLEVIKAKLDKTPKPGLELWSDMPYMEIMNGLPSFLSKLLLLKIRRVIFQIDRSSPDDHGHPRWRWPRRALNEVMDALRGSQISPGILIYIWPSKRYMDASLSYIKRLSLRRGDVLELDLEHNWKFKELEGFDSLRDAGQYFLKNLSIPEGVILSSTTYPLHGENIKTASLASDPMLEMVAPQAYSGYRKGDPSYGLGQPYGPGRIQSLSYGRALTLQKKETVLGLPLYGQAGLFQDAADGLDAAYMAARMLMAHAVRFWSSKHLWSLAHGKNSACSWLYEISNEPCSAFR